VPSCDRRRRSRRALLNLDLSRSNQSGNWSPKSRVAVRHRAIAIPEHEHIRIADHTQSDAEGAYGRQTVASRKETLAAFFDIVRKQAACQQAADRIDARMENAAHGFTGSSDCQAHGLDGKTTGRVTLYCNPHDQVISATTVQGIGWRGMSAQEIKDTRGDGVFTQRVFAQGWRVGHETKTTYRYWTDQYNLQPMGEAAVGSQAFWQPESPLAKYSVQKGVAADHILGRIFTVLAAPVMTIVIWALRIRINALPPAKDEDTGKPWEIPLEAPKLPEPFEPKAFVFEKQTNAFDQKFDAPGTYRNQGLQRSADDPLGQITRSQDGRTDAPLGSESSEASLQYENHAYMRMEARRAGIVASNQKVVQEEPQGQATPDYTAWRNEKIKTYLAENIDTHATDHSTIVTNPMHAERALAYDVAIGCCDIYEKDMRKLRVAADWRFLDGIDNNDPQKDFYEYFDAGQFQGISVQKWANSDANVTRPEKIIEQRYWGPAEPNRIP
jgi:hypothetical protein